MSLNATLNNAISGLSMAQRSLATVSNNIANVSTPGYTRKTTTQYAAVAGGVGMGVTAGDLKRSIDVYLQRQQRVTSGELAKSTVVDQVYERLQLSPLGDASSNLSDLLTSFQTAVGTLANSPSDSTARSAVVSAGNAVAGAIGETADLIQSLRADADQEIADQVSEINDILAQLQSLNRELGRGTPEAELLDRRDTLLDSLASKLDISIHEESDGQLRINTTNGTTLLDDKARVLAYSAATTVTASTRFGALSVYSQSQIDDATGQPQVGARGITLVSSGLRADASDAADRTESDIGSGSLAGLLEVRDLILPQLNDELAALAGQMVEALNAAHNASTSIPLPATLTGSRQDTSSFATATRSGSFALAVIDTDGNAVASASLDLASYGSMTDLVADLNAQLGGAATATITANGSVTITTADNANGLAYSEGDSQVGATGGEPAQGLAQYLGLNDLFTVSALDPTHFAVRADIAADPSLLANAQASASGTPASWSIGGSGDASGFAALAAAFSATIAYPATGRVAATSTSFVSYAARIASQLASDTTSASSSLATKQDLSDSLSDQQATASGVSIDEELARLIAYQQAYSASARLIQVTSDLFDKLFNAAS